jgi:hypothetical protein
MPIDHAAARARNWDRVMIKLELLINEWQNFVLSCHTTHFIQPELPTHVIVFRWLARVASSSRCWWQKLLRGIISERANNTCDDSAMLRNVCAIKWSFLHTYDVVHLYTYVYEYKFYCTYFAHNGCLERILKLFQQKLVHTHCVNDDQHYTTVFLLTKS